MRVSFVICLIATAHTVQGQSRFDLSPEALAYCLDQSDSLLRLDEHITALTDKRGKLSAVQRDIRLQLGSLRDTARVDTNVAVKYRAIELDGAKVAKLTAEAAQQLDAALRNRQNAGQDYESRCVGRSYNADDLIAAEQLRSSSNPSPD